MIKTFILKFKNIFIILSSILMVSIFFLLKPKTTIEEAEITMPLVEVKTVKKKSNYLSIKSEGTVKPLLNTILLPQISGKIIEISEKFHNGSYFNKGDTLLKIDPEDYVEWFLPVSQ